MSLPSPRRDTYKKNIQYYKKLVTSPTDVSPSKEDPSSSFSNAAITQSQALEFEQRLTSLERKIGVDKQNGETLDDRLSTLKANLHTKLATSEQSSKSTSTSNTTSDNWKIIQKLLKELDPGIALTHQQQPLLYKRQQVLACSDELTNDFGELERILKFLLKGTHAKGDTGSMQAEESQTTTSTLSKSLMQKTPQTKSQDLAQQAKEKAEQKLLQKQEQQQQQHQAKHGDATTLRLDQVTQAPILTQHYAQCEVTSEQKRVQDLHLKLRALNQRTKALQQTLRHYLECYHTTAMVVSEKIVLADELITAKLSDTWKPLEYH